MLPNLSNENSGDRDVDLATAPSTTRSRSALETRKGVAMVGDEGGAGGDGGDGCQGMVPVEEYSEVVSRLDRCQAHCRLSDRDMLLGQGSVESWTTHQGGSASGSAAKTSAPGELTTATSLPSSTSTLEARPVTGVLGSSTSVGAVQPQSAAIPTAKADDRRLSGSCPATCQGYTCDQWGNSNSAYTCSFLESNSCDCAGW